MCEVLYELSIVAHKAEKSSKFCVSLGQYTFYDGSQIQIARPHTSLGDSVHQVVDLFLGKAAL